MNLVKRVIRRSGELVFLQTTDAAENHNDPRLSWLGSWLAGSIAGAAVADVGCWTGTLVKWALDLGAANATGIDLPGPWIEAAKANIPDATWVPASSLSALPQSLSGQFEVVFFLETLEHLPVGTEHSGLTALRRLLAPGGILICSTPIAGLMALTDPAWPLLGHRHYSPAALLKLLTTSGMFVDELCYSGNLYQALAINTLYVEKHLLRHTPRQHQWLERRANTGLQMHRQATSTTVWARARAASPERSLRQ